VLEYVQSGPGMDHGTRILYNRQPFPHRRQDHPTMDHSDIERRLNRDRRGTPTRPVSRYTLRGRRRGDRRGGACYVDRYDNAWLMAAVGLMVLGCMDGWNTLYLLHHGAREANPFMSALLGYNPAWFVGVKLLLTTAGTLVMISHSQFTVYRGVTGHRLLLISFMAYAVLVACELGALR
jgi:hypothetical protein